MHRMGLVVAVVGTMALTSCKGQKQEEYTKSLKPKLPPSCTYSPSDVTLSVDCDGEAGVDKLKEKFAADCRKIKDAGWTGIVIDIDHGKRMYSAGGLEPLGNCAL